MKLVLWQISGSQIPERASDVTMLDVNYASHPDLVTHLADGWQMINHTVQPVDDDVLLSLFLIRPAEAPEDVSGLPVVG